MNLNIGTVKKPSAQPFPMKAISPCVRLTAVAVAACLLCACASESELTAIRLDTSHPLYATEACQQSMSAARIHEDTKLVSTIATPVLVFLSGGLLLPLIGANAGLDAVDRIDASNMAIRCGGKGKTANQITEGVLQGAAMGLVGVPAK